jgi:hypothetical protein
MTEPLHSLKSKPVPIEGILILKAADLTFPLKISRYLMTPTETDPRALLMEVEKRDVYQTVTRKGLPGAIWREI